MNVGGMTADNPSWKVFAATIVPGTFIGGSFVWLGWYFWSRPSSVRSTSKTARFVQEKVIREKSMGGGRKRMPTTDV